MLRITLSVVIPSIVNSNHFYLISHPPNKYFPKLTLPFNSFFHSTNIYWVFTPLVTGLEPRDSTGNIIYSPCLLHLVHSGSETEITAIVSWCLFEMVIDTPGNVKNSNKVWTKDFMWRVSVKCEHVTHLKYTLELNQYVYLHIKLSDVQRFKSMFIL